MIGTKRHWNLADELADAFEEDEAAEGLAELTPAVRCGYYFEDSSLMHPVSQQLPYYRQALLPRIPSSPSSPPSRGQTHSIEDQLARVTCRLTMTLMCNS